MPDLSLTWAFLIAFAVLAYVVLDGFDLGVGILFPFVKSERDKATVISAIAPVWDGNETWLVMGGGGLLAAFPLAYSILMPAFYAPLIAMLVGLVFRGVAFEFRHRTRKIRHLWDFGFFGGSVLAALSQGVILGAFVQGVAVEGRHYVGGWADWLTPFSLLTGIALVTGYGLLGAGWLIMKTEGDLQRRLYGLTRPLGGAVVASIVAVSIWTPLLDSEIAHRWFSWPNIALVSPVPLLIAGASMVLFLGVAWQKETWPFFASLSLFALSYCGLGISLYPYVVPRSITIMAAAAPDESLSFMLVGAAILLPIILGYTAYVYWVFRGKADPTAGYHE